MCLTIADVGCVYGVCMWISNFASRTDPHLVGNRTDFRVNCLYGSRAVSDRELCIVSRAWWAQRWGKEGFANNRQICCDKVCGVYMRYT